MPGHKRNAPGFASRTLSGALRIDFTETPSTDDLHEAKGILKDAQERANAMYGAGCGLSPGGDMETFFLVGGSSAGVLAAVSTAAGTDGDIIALSGAHRSFDHAAELMRLKVISLTAPQMRDADGNPCDFPGILPPEEIESAIRANPQAKAVFVTSPSYEGVIQDIEAIAKIAHAHGLPLIVDEAHGAHFSLHPQMPVSALAYGADLVNHSVHKTLSGMTQTALLHVRGERIDRAKLRHYLNVFQSSSPSYVLMASIDEALKDIRRYGGVRFADLLSYKKELLALGRELKRLRIADEGMVPDPCKLVLFLPEDAAAGTDGAALAARLRDEFAIEAERAEGRHLILILTPYDIKEGILRLSDALRAIDASL